MLVNFRLFAASLSHRNDLFIVSKVTWEPGILGLLVMLYCVRGINSLEEEREEPCWEEVLFWNFGNILGGVDGTE